MYKGNHFIKSFTASTYVMMFMAIFAFSFDFLSGKIALILIITLAILGAVNMYLSKRY